MTNSMFLAFCFSFAVVNILFMLAAMWYYERR